MAAIINIIILIVVVLVISFVLRMLGKAFKWLMFLWLGIMVIGVVLGVIVFKDVMDLKENIGTERKLILFDLDGDLITGFYLDDFEDIFSEEGKDIGEIMKKIQIPDLPAMNKYYAAQDYEKMLGDNYKMFIAKKEMFDLATEAEIGEAKLTKEEIISSIASDDPKSIIVSKLVGDEPETRKAFIEEQLREEIGEDNAFKNFLFLSLFGKAQENAGSTYLLDEYKEGNLIIYEETITFKLMKKLPIGLFGNTFGGATSKIE